MITQMENKFELCLSHLSEILSVLKTASQYERIFHLIVYHISTTYKCQSCAIVLIDPKTEYLNIVNSQGLSHTFCVEYRKRLATGAIGRLLWTGKPILITDNELQSQIAEEIKLEHSFSSCVCIQMAMDHKTIGYLYADSKVKNNFNEEDIPILQMYADIASMAYHKYYLCEENMRLDKIDHETGVEKYTSFIQKVVALLDHAKQFSEPFSLILLDVDNIKSIINTYGHQAAIDLLRQIAVLIKENIQSVLSIGRYGFDELIILTEKTSLLEAQQNAERLRDIVERTPFTSHNLRSTVSIGLSSYPQNAQSVDELIVTIKNALFEAQRTGKNKVFYYEKEWYAR